MVDFAGGHPSSEDARKAIEALDDELGSAGLSFHPGVEYRHIVVAPASWAEASCTPPHDLTGKPVVWPSGPAAPRLQELMDASREVVGRFAVGQRPWGLAQTSDGRKLYAVNGLSNDVSVVDLATKEIVATIPVGERPWGVAIGRIGAIETVSTTGTAGITGASVR